MINLAHPISIVAISATLALLIRFSVPSLKKSFERAGSLVATIARSWIRSAAIVFLFSFTTSALPSVIYSVPAPLVQDEFAYLLLGDTFAHGRLTNPPHPMSEFFETFHVIQHPTYAAKFPIGQGVALAIGFKLGVPIIGVWLSVALACVAVEWMLRAFVPPHWSLLGALLCALHPLVLWWSNSYWGGAVAMLGGALLIGSAARLMRATPRLIDSIFLGLALSALALSRPLEGLILSILVLIPLVTTAIQRVLAPGGIRRITITILPCTIILLPIALFVIHYNTRVTGNPWTLPYTVHARHYMTAPLLYYQPLNTPAPYKHKIFEDFHATIELDEYRTSRWWTKPPMLAMKYFDPPTLIIPLIAAIWTARKRRAVIAMLVLCIALPAIHMALTPWMRAVYMSPLMAPLYLLIVTGLRELAHRRAFALVLFVIVSQFVAWIVYLKPAAALAHDGVAVERAKLIERLSDAGGQHLVLVSYGPNHKPLFEFVYNAADVDNSPVVFARSMGAEKDRELLDYFRERKVWDLYYDDGPYRVTPR